MNPVSGRDLFVGYGAQQPTYLSDLRLRQLCHSMGVPASTRAMTERIGAILAPGFPLQVPRIETPEVALSAVVSRFMLRARRLAVRDPAHIPRRRHLSALNKHLIPLIGGMRKWPQQAVITAVVRVSADPRSTGSRRGPQSLVWVAMRAHAVVVQSTHAVPLRRAFTPRNGAEDASSFGRRDRLTTRSKSGPSSCPPPLIRRQNRRFIGHGLTILENWWPPSPELHPHAHQHRQECPSAPGRDRGREGPRRLHPQGPRPSPIHGRRGPADRRQERQEGGVNGPAYDVGVVGRSSGSWKGHSPPTSQQPRRRLGEPRGHRLYRDS